MMCKLLVDVHCRWTESLNGSVSCFHLN